MNEINLNADLGESVGEAKIGDDGAMLAIVRSANVACGFHGGDPLVMVQTIDEALRKGVSIGAHPSFPDREGFGRRKMTLPPDELDAVLLYQLAALDGVARSRGGRMTHVKPHGALNNMACEDAELATRVARAVRMFDRDVIFLAPALSELSKAGRKAGLRVAEEIFADRAYTDQGMLVPRSQAGAMIEGADNAARHVLAMLEAGALVTASGKRLPCEIHSVCVHGDEPSAVATASAVKKALEGAGCRILPLSEMAAMG